MRLRLVILIIFVFCCAGMLTAQTDSIPNDSALSNPATTAFKPNLEFNGYIKLLEQSLVLDNNADWINDFLVHNRLNFKFLLTKHLNVVAEFRNRFYVGEMMNIYPGYDTLSTIDDGFVDMSWNLLTKNNYFLNVFLDRAFIDYSKGKLQITIGRQRINWGQTFAWNPNDIFNIYSFYDVDYEERPGCDAIRVQYYRKATSSLEIAAKLNSENQFTGAFLYKTNYRKYDVQAMAGVYDDSDLVAGLGWSGDLFKGGFRGEFSYFHRAVDFVDTTGTVLLSVGYDYAFKNEAMVRAEVLYNSAGKKNANVSMQELYYQHLTAKNISVSQFSIFSMISYPITPIILTSFSVNYSPGIYSLYLGPTLDVSLKDNLDMSLIAQSFLNQLNQSDIELVFLLYARVKWSF
jgi:hypothetical protein